MISGCAGIRNADRNGRRQGQTGLRRTTEYKGRAAFRRRLGSALQNDLADRGISRHLRRGRRARRRRLSGWDIFG
jgi:hypothetical protein